MVSLGKHKLVITYTCNMFLLENTNLLCKLVMASLGKLKFVMVSMENANLLWFLLCVWYSLSMFSGLETRSLRLYTLGTTWSPASSQTVQVGRPSTASWV